MNPKSNQTILLIGNDSSLIYLFGRFADYGAYHVAVTSENASIKDVEPFNLIAIIFLSIEILENAQPLAAELVSRELPIMVCSSVADESRAKELGADYRLLHPFTYDDFQTALANVNASKRT